MPHRIDGAPRPEHSLGVRQGRGQHEKPVARCPLARLIPLRRHEPARPARLIDLDRVLKGVNGLEVLRTAFDGSRDVGPFGERWAFLAVAGGDRRRRTGGGASKLFPLASIAPLDCQRSDPKQASGGARRRQKTPGGIIPFRWAASSRFGGRHHSVTTGDIISFWWAASPGISMPIARSQVPSRKTASFRAPELAVAASVIGSSCLLIHNIAVRPGRQFGEL